MSLPQPNLRELATFAMRLVAFAATLVIMGAFFLPWARLDGMSEASSGAALVALVVSPTINYLFAVSTLQAVVLVGCPVLLILSATVVMAKYARRKTAPFATCLVFASSVSVIYGAPDLTTRNEVGAYIGLSLIVALSGSLAYPSGAHQTTRESVPSTQTANCAPGSLCPNRQRPLPME